MEYGPHINAMLWLFFTRCMPDSSIQQITTENAKSSSLNLQPDYNQTKRMMVHGPEAVQIFDSADKVGVASRCPYCENASRIQISHISPQTDLHEFRALRILEWRWKWFVGLTNKYEDHVTALPYLSSCHLSGPGSRVQQPPPDALTAPLGES